MNAETIVTEVYFHFCFVFWTFYFQKTVRKIKLFANAVHLFCLCRLEMFTQIFKMELSRQSVMAHKACPKFQIIILIAFKLVFFYKNMHYPMSTTENTFNLDANFYPYFYSDIILIVMIWYYDCCVCLAQESIHSPSEIYIWYTGCHCLRNKSTLWYGNMQIYIYFFILLTTYFVIQVKHYIQLEFVNENMQSSIALSITILQHLQQQRW